MAEFVRQQGMVPFFKCAVPGWSVQDRTAPGCWFDENGADGVLGPWDWKVDVVNGGGIAYGKFLGGKAAFATEEFYAHLANWRRSLAKYRVPVDGPSRARSGRSTSATGHAKLTNTDKLMRALAPTALAAIREYGAVGSKQIRTEISKVVTPALVRSLGAKYRPLLVPGVKKNIVDSVLGYLQMGTWAVVGSIERVYRGPQLAYSGWQLASNTMPEAFFGKGEGPSETATAPACGTSAEPSWAKRFDAGAASVGSVCTPFPAACTPEESREYLIGHVLSLYPGTDRRILEKMI